MHPIELPKAYIDTLAQIETREISYGVGGLKLFNIDEVPAGQVGYSVSQGGRSLYSPAAGRWRPSWIVIGLDTGLGDPIILDTADARLPVYASMHGEGVWELQSIAISIEAFRECFREFEAVARDRSSPVEKDANPLSDEERVTYRGRIAKINEGILEPNFWDPLLEY